MQVSFIGIVKAVLSMDLFQVLSENWLVSENHVTVVAAVRFVPTVQVQVIQQRTLLGEGFTADFTLKGLDAGVDAHMSVQVSFLCEGLSTQEAHEQLVHLEVICVVLKLAEDTGTLRALVVPLEGFVIVSLVSNVFVCRRGKRRGTERVPGHTGRNRHLTASTVHSGVDE